nr:hypothetical protein CISIN_1g032779mg [Ipomoea batatas]GMD69339.1 hypothetical protein CISIN_1g032779mg [Ipomoea batatas]
MELWFVHQLEIMVFQAALLFIWLQEGDLLIVSVNCWHGVQIDFKETLLGEYHIRLLLGITTGRVRLC